MRAQLGNIDATSLIVYKIISTTFANNESHVVRCLAKWKKWSLEMGTFEFNPNSIEKVLAVLFYTWERSISKQQQQTLSLHNSRTRFIAVRSELLWRTSYFRVPVTHCFKALLLLSSSSPQINTNRKITSAAQLLSSLLSVTSTTKIRIEKKHCHK